MTRRRTQTLPPLPGSPLDVAMTADEQAVADELSEILDAIAPFDQGSVKGVLYQKPQAGQGSWKWIDEVFPPFDLSAIYQDMKDNYGGGDYQLRVFAGGKPRKNHDFTIIKPRNTPAVAVAQPAGMSGSSEMLQFMIAQQNEARRDAAAANERQMNMFMQMSRNTSELMIAAIGGKGGGAASETVALIAALQGMQPKGGGIKDTLEAMAAFKQILGPGEERERDGQSFRLDPDDLISSAAGLIGPGVKALGDYMARRQAAAGEAGAPSANGSAAALAGGGQLALGAPASRFRLLDLVRDDLAYMFARGFEPEKVADLVYDVIEANNVTEAEINEVGAAFALSPTGLADLAREGIDLTSNPQWAADFFAALLAIHQGETDNRDGEPGGETDPPGDGEPGAVGPT